MVEAELPPEGRSDQGTRFDRPAKAVEPGLPEHNPQLHQISVFVLENFFSEHYNQMLAEPEH
jgi:hypothetical protein